MSKRKKSNNNSDSLNTTNDKSELKVNMNTNSLVEKGNLQWISKIKVLPLGVISFAAFLGSIVTYVNYSIELDKNRQEVSYMADLAQLSERIEKNAFAVKNGQGGAFAEMENSKNNIDKLLSVLQNGGKVKGADTEISAIEDRFSTQLNVVVSEWNNNKALINSLLSQKEKLSTLFNDVKKAQKNNQLLIDEATVLQRHVERYNIPALNKSGQEMVLLATRITQSLDDLSSDSFSLEKGYSIVKDMRTFEKLIQQLNTGDAAMGIPNADNETLVSLNNISSHFAPFSALTNKVVSSINDLNNAKSASLQISVSAQNIAKTVANLNNEYIKDSGTLGLYRGISIALLALGLIGIALLTLIFYERSLQALRFAKLLEQNQTNEMAINMLLSQMEPLDRFDFTNRVYVDDKSVLPISQKVDKTREILGDIVRRIKITSELINKSAESTDATSQRLLDVSKEQYEKVGDSISKIGKITSEMDEVSQATWLAQEDSNRSRTASQNGEKLVRESILKMDEIRHTIQESSKKIKKLGESAQAITEVTGLIQDITKQINVLALNAAIQAASSGESGREFTVVAQEVQRLAYDSETATKKIEELIGDIQSDTAAAVASMEQTTQEVVAGAKLTDNAGKALKEIESLSQEVASRVAEASSKLEEKSSEMANIALEMKDLQNITEKAAIIVKTAAEQVESLKEISSELDTSINQFKV